MALLDQSFFHYSLLSYYLLGPPTFIALRFFQFPYGKHNRLGWGPTIPPTLAWFIMESPSTLLPLILFPFGHHFTNPKALVLMSPYLLHYFHRTFIYPLRIYQSTSQQNTKTTIGFPLILTFNGFLTQALNTYIQARWGMRINMWADTALLVLKRESGGYKVPRGGWFELVTCPNHFGEIVEWLGWAVMTWSWAGFGFFLYTCSNLVPRACANHKWYLQKFGEDYPKNRKAVIPFLV
ncbi:hypothetical protein H0E87_022823 [Populus deltoides]|uniref:3-oxo-5-alpha-steroid 4-dehydrogenase C-terminal domain-containing protein n=1 Tax=Populus deltoides TaxID=3696 RepID=A0A8T2XCB9_POPDE|nr:hypothetical protein H0E87_022823 [Populus deltoides]